MEALLQSAATGLSAAQIILLTILTFKVYDIDDRVKRMAKNQQRIIVRLNTLSNKAGLDEVESE